GACSTTWPAYMTVMRCAISATSARSWLTKTIAKPSFSRSSSSSATTWAWTVTSRAVVGSSAMMSFGSRVSAMAMSTRWRWRSGVRTHELEELLGRPGAAAARGLLRLGADEHRRVERAQRVLVDHRDVRAAQRRALAVAHGEQVLAAVEDLAADLGGRVEQAHDGERRDRLAAAGLADERHRLAGTHRERHVVDDRDVAVA